MSVYGVLKYYSTRNQPFCCCKKKKKIISREKGLPGGAMIKNLPAKARDARDMASIPGSGRSPGKGNGNPL